MLKGLVTLKDLEILLGHLRGDANLLSLSGEVNEYFSRLKRPCCAPVSGQLSVVSSHF